jgi:ubiquitin-conjugating enzyme E2 J2
MMLTPSGRFEPGAKICLSISDFHPESWNPLWGVSMILLGLQSFFYDTASTTGALHNVSAAEKRRFASQSLEYNARNLTYRKLFPDLIKLAKEREIERAKKAETEITPAAAAAGDNNNKSNENGARIGLGTDGLPQHQGNGAPAAVDIRGREGANPNVGAKELAIGAAALVVAVGVAFVALERF